MLEENTFSLLLRAHVLVHLTSSFCQPAQLSLPSTKPLQWHEGDGIVCHLRVIVAVSVVLYLTGVLSLECVLDGGQQQCV